MEQAAAPGIGVPLPAGKITASPEAMGTEEAIFETPRGTFRDRLRGKIPPPVAAWTEHYVVVLCRGKNYGCALI
ncbi:MAG: hypothetical protein LBQ00_04170 [Syntrophobacterales bacterium]|nr:hypothetical protein [Syntrophobacterales bacterium]